MDTHEQTITILQAIRKEMLSISQRDQDCAQLLKEQLRKLETILIGVDGTNGVRSMARQHEADISDLKKWRTQFMTIFATVQLFAVPLLIFIIEKYIK